MILGEQEGIEALCSLFSSSELRQLLADWEIWAHPEQLPRTEPWSTWLFLGGRGAGKTRAGAEWVRGMALGRPPFAHEPAGRIAIIGETLHDVREVMIEGVSGILAVHNKSERPVYEATRRRLVWPNGSVAHIFSAESPDALRGPQFHAAWCDEIAKWRTLEQTWAMLQFGLRLGAHPKVCVTTTPRPVPLLKQLILEDSCHVSRASTRANAGNLSPVFLDAVLSTYGGTRFGRQELNGEIIEDREDALWSRNDIDAARVGVTPDLLTVVVAVDPPASSSKTADACGIVAVGRDDLGRFFVVVDETVQGVGPATWAKNAVQLYHKLGADRIVAEVNQGGDMVEAVIHQADPLVPVQKVRATRGKWLRAEPIAMLYAQHRVSHVGSFPELEDEMCDFGRDGLSNGHSPDRVDALVWGLTAINDFGKTPRIRDLN